MTPSRATAPTKFPLSTPLFSHSQENGGDLGPPNAGDALAVLSAVLFAAQITAAEHQMRTLPKGSELALMAVSTLTVAALTAATAAAMHAGDLPAAGAKLGMLFAGWHDAVASALGLAAAAGADGASAAAASSTTAAAASVVVAQQLFYTAVVTTDLVLLAELFALQDVSSTDAAMIYSLEPALGALLAWALLGERWGAWGWAGAGLILAASLATQMAGATDGDEGEGGGGGGGASSSAGRKSGRGSSAGGGGRGGKK